MYKHILIATDGSELANKAVTKGLGLAKALGAKATVVTVTEPWSAVMAGEVAVALPIDQYDQSCAEGAAAILSAAANVAKEIGFKPETLHVKDRYPAEGIIEAAKSQGADLIVMASHGRRGFSRLLLGSQANRVITHTELPVLIHR